MEAAGVEPLRSLKRRKLLSGEGRKSPKVAKSQIDCTFTVRPHPENPLNPIHRHLANGEEVFGAVVPFARFRCGVFAAPHVAMAETAQEERIPLARKDGNEDLELADRVKSFSTR